MQEIILKNNLSDHFVLTTYPDGQHSIKLHLDKLNVKEPVSIKCRIRNFGELEVLLCLVTALRKYDFYVEKINFVYLFGMRSDRAFEIGEPNYFRDVVAPIINNLKIKNISVFWPHGNTTLRSINSIGFIDFTSKIFGDSYLIAGDQSTDPESKMNFFVKSRKDRRISVQLKNPIPTGINEVIIIDDLCDGGATFIAEGEYLKRNYQNIKLKLFVAHGLFTQGVHALLSYFDEIICTNSYQDIEHPNVKQIKVI
jgi:ribose-phosphate pyrophosphokinase